MSTKIAKFLLISVFVLLFVVLIVMCCGIPILATYEEMSRRQEKIEYIKKYTHKSSKKVTGKFIYVNHYHPDHNRTVYVLFSDGYRASVSELEFSRATIGQEFTGEWFQLDR